jgi:serine/threonine-protein kinase RsbT
MRTLTVVSELARNIVSYSVGGSIDLDLESDGVAVTARDRGPGIHNLDEILSGRYVSRTGLGQGILGVRRLSREFAIETSSQGTSVSCKVPL